MYEAHPDYAGEVIRLCRNSLPQHSIRSASTCLNIQLDTAIPTPTSVPHRHQSTVGQSPQVPKQRSLGSRQRRSERWGFCNRHLWLLNLSGSFYSHRGATFLLAARLSQGQTLPRVRLAFYGSQLWRIKSKRPETRQQGLFSRSSGMGACNT